MSDPKMNAQAEAGAKTTEATGLLDGLLQGTGAKKTAGRETVVQGAVQTLAEWALKDTALVSDEALDTVNAVIAAIDQKLASQVNEILHHADFQQLEGSWRGLEHLVSNTESSQRLKIRVLNISKKELNKTLKRFRGAAFDQSPVFKLVYTGEYSQWGGEPYGCLVGDYYFDHSAEDVKLLEDVSKIASASHCPFIAGAGPSICGMETWQTIMNPRDLEKIFSTPEYAAWRSLRESEDSRYLGLAMPRFLARLPYGAKTNPVEEFAFEEDTAGADHAKYSWSNSAYAMGLNITQAFAADGWLARIRGIKSGGLVEGLPVHTFPTDDGGVDMKCPTEVAMDDRREAELAKLGFMPLLHKKNSDMAAFVGAQSLQKPAEFQDKDASANAKLAASLPYLFSACRFAHYLKAIVREQIGTFKERADMQRFLEDWVRPYITGDPVHASDDEKARKPLAGAEVVVSEVEGSPGAYSAKIFLRPHYQLESLHVQLGMVAKLPSQKQG